MTKRHTNTAKPYVAIVDQRSPHRANCSWYTGNIKYLTDEQAKPLLDKGKIREANIEPKRFIEIISGDGTSERISWSEYLKKRRKHNETHNP